MPVATKAKKSAYRSVLSAAKKLSPEEKQLLRMELFGNELLREAMLSELNTAKGKPVIKKSDAEIVKLVKSIRKRNYARTQKMLH
jgi:hypothetical protein